MSPALEVIHPDATLLEASQQMKGLDGGPLLVCDSDRLMGFLSARDITTWSAAEGADPKLEVVRDAMSTNLVYCYEDQPIGDAARLMEQRRLRRLPVLDRAGRLVGTVALEDVLEAVSAG